jgi:hypothetical protein
MGGMVVSVELVGMDHLVLAVMRAVLVVPEVTDHQVAPCISVDLLVKETEIFKSLALSEVQSLLLLEEMAERVVRELPVAREDLVVEKMVLEVEVEREVLLVQCMRVELSDTVHSSRSLSIQCHQATMSLLLLVMVELVVLVSLE